MIEIRDIHKAFPLNSATVNVLDGVDMDIGAGETVAIVGPSGSGKTTLLVLLAGLEKPDAGSISFDGVDITGLDGDQLADIRRDRVGIVFQSFHLVPSLTALGNVALPIEIRGGSDARERALQQLTRVGLADRAEHYPAQLSGGEQQRVAIARALVHAPDIVLADEPTGNLDLRTGANIIDMLFQLNAESGSTLVMVTHDNEVARRCRRVFRLDDGRLVEDGDHALPA